MLYVTDWKVHITHLQQQRYQQVCPCSKTSKSRGHFLPVVLGKQDSDSLDDWPHRIDRILWVDHQWNKTHWPAASYMLHCWLCHDVLWQVAFWGQPGILDLTCTTIYICKFGRALVYEKVVRPKPLVILGWISRKSTQRILGSFGRMLPLVNFYIL